MRRRKWLLFPLLLGACLLVPIDKLAAQDHRAGQTHTGMIRRETADAIRLFTTDRSEVRIPRTQIEEMVPSSVSVMPQGLEKKLTAEQLRDRIAVLGSLK